MFGPHSLGKVDKVAGDAVTTDFFAAFFAPLFPIASYYVSGDRQQSEPRRVQRRLHGRSVFWGYVRGWSTVAFVVCAFILTVNVVRIGGWKSSWEELAYGVGGLAVALVVSYPLSKVGGTTDKDVRLITKQITGIAADLAQCDERTARGQRMSLDNALGAHGIQRWRDGLDASLAGEPLPKDAKGLLFLRLRIEIALTPPTEHTRLDELSRQVLEAPEILVETPHLQVLDHSPGSPLAHHEASHELGTMTDDAEVALATAVAAGIQEAAPELEVRHGAPNLLLVRHRERGLETLVGLSSLRSRVASQPERLDELVAEQVARVPIEELRSGQLNHPPVLSESLFPRLTPRTKLDAVLEAAPEGYVGPMHEPFALDETLYITLVTTTFDGHRYVNEGELTELDMDWDRAQEQACANLAAYVEGQPPQALPGPDGRTMMVVFEHPHAAACLLLPSLLPTLADSLGAEFSCCAPALDELVAFRAHDDELASAVMERARASFEDDPQPVTRQVFSVGSDGVLKTSRSESA